MCILLHVLLHVPDTGDPSEVTGRLTRDAVHAVLAQWSPEIGNLLSVELDGPCDDSTASRIPETEGGR